MVEDNKSMDDQSEPRQTSLFRLIIDQPRVTEDVRNYKFEGSGTEEDPYEVIFIPHDAGNPFNWTSKRKWFITMVAATECFATAISSSAFSGTIKELVINFHASPLLITSGLSLFVLGFAVGPLLWAPLSEIYGRQIIFAVSFMGFSVFSAACTANSGIATLLVMRFFAGSFGASPFTNAGGVIADMFPAAQRGLAMSVFALAPCMGPTMGPFIAGFLGETEGWRWVMGLMTIFVGFMWFLGMATVPETYGPALLRARARKLAKLSGKVYKTKSEIEKGYFSPGHILKTALIRPWILLFMEPIVLVLSVYLAILYGTLYLLFGAYPIVFQIGRGWNEGVGGLAFLGVAVGMFLAVFFQIWANGWYIKTAEKNGGIAPAEARLVPCMIGAVTIPIGMFWFAWTCYPSIHWISPVMAGAPFGFGFTLIFLGITNYLIDAYTIFAASVLAANAVLRSLFGAGFPLFTHDMYARLGNHWATSIPAFLALVCVPAPFVLYKYGAAIRSKCVYAAEAEEAMENFRRKSVSEKPAGSQEMFYSDDETTNASSNDGVENVKIEGSTEPLGQTMSRAKTRNSSGGELTKLRTVGSHAEAAKYEHGPYDIDRVNTHNSIAGVDFKKVRSRREKQ